MKHFSILLSLLILALVLSGCGSTSREPYSANLDGQRVVTIHPAAGTIQYGNDLYRYKIKNVWGGVRYELTYPNGQRHTWTESKETGEGSWSEGYKPSIYLPGELLVNVLKKPAPESPRLPREKKGNPVAGILCSLGGIVLMILHKHEANYSGPRRFRKSGRYWVEVSPEMSAAATFVEGLFLLIVGLCLCIF